MKLKKRDQLGHIAAEIKRASAAQKDSPPLAKEMLARALYLAELTLSDPQWRSV